MDIYEEAVLNYITSNNSRFVNPQFNIEWDSKNKIGGTLPDFVVMDFSNKTIYIIEVTKAYDIAKLLSKVEQRQTGWIEPIKKLLDNSFRNWQYHVTLFLRDDRVGYAKRKIEDYKSQVSIISLKKINVFLGDGTFEGENKLQNT